MWYWGATTINKQNGLTVTVETRDHIEFVRAALVVASLTVQWPHPFTEVRIEPICGARPSRWDHVAHVTYFHTV
jgi:hypothetical protein